MGRLTPGTNLAEKFRIVRVTVESSAEIVYDAIDLRTNERVTIKTPPAGASVEAVAQFEKRAGVEKSNETVFVVSDADTLEEDEWEPISQVEPLSIPGVAQHAPPKPALPVPKPAVGAPSAPRPVPPAAHGVAKPAVIPAGTAPSRPVALVGVAPTAPVKPCAPPPAPPAPRARVATIPEWPGAGPRAQARMDASPPAARALEQDALRTPAQIEAQISVEVEVPASEEAPAPEVMEEIDVTDVAASQNPPNDERTDPGVRQRAKRSARMRWFVALALLGGVLIGAGAWFAARPKPGVQAAPRPPAQETRTEPAVTPPPPVTSFTQVPPATPDESVAPAPTRVAPPPPPPATTKTVPTRPPPPKKPPVRTSDPPLTL